MKKHLSLLLSTLVIFSLISCNKEQQEQPVDSKDSSSLPILITSALDTSSTSNEAPSSNTVSTTSTGQEETYYHVTFVNYDETVLYEADVLEGNAALYSGEEPVKAEDEECTYKFIGWDKDLTNIQSDTTFVAQFEAVSKGQWGPINWF